MPFIVEPRDADPFFFDHDALRDIAKESIVVESLRCYRDQRVMAIDQGEGRLWADVQDAPGIALAGGHRSL